MTGNPTYGPFASAIGLLIWIDLVSRFLLLTAAWTATGRQPPAPDDCADTPEAGLAVDVADRPPGGRRVIGPVPAGDGRNPAADGAGNGTPNPVAVAGVLVGTGAALGVGAAAAGHRYRRRRR